MLLGFLLGHCFPALPRRLLLGTGGWLKQMHNPRRGLACPGAATDSVLGRLEAERRQQCACWCDWSGCMFESSENRRAALNFEAQTLNLNLGRETSNKGRSEHGNCISISLINLSALMHARKSCPWQPSWSGRNHASRPSHAEHCSFKVVQTANDAPGSRFSSSRHPTPATQQQQQMQTRLRPRCCLLQP